MKEILPNICMFNYFLHLLIAFLGGLNPLFLYTELKHIGYSDPFFNLFLFFLLLLFTPLIHLHNFFCNVLSNHFLFFLFSEFRIKEYFGALEEKPHIFFNSRRPDSAISPICRALRDEENEYLVSIFFDTQ